MSKIYFAVCVLFLASTILAAMPPTDVYSAIIYNAQDSKISCRIVWSKPSNAEEEDGLFTIDKGKYYTVNEKQIDMGDWVARGAIHQIQCGDLVLTAPFDGVNSPSVNWKFRIESNEIVSVVSDSDSSEH